jgi:hypothetical protein
MTGRDRGSAIWRVGLAVMYRLIRFTDPLLRRGWRASLSSFERTVELRVPGRGTGRMRGTLLTLLTLDGRGYIGHPNGPAAWTRNLDAADAADLVGADGVATRVRGVRLEPGDERRGVVDATASQQPFPGNVVYFLARRHIDRVGVYYRVEPVAPR